MTKGRLVYSTGPGGAEETRTEETRDSGVPRVSLPPERQNVRVRLERSGRRGKIVTVAAPLALTEDDARELLKRLKRGLGSGGKLQLPGAVGATEELGLELQGDHVERLVAELAAFGYRVRRSG